ncbi:MAG: YitT family protein [Clostridia bacterium]|nr:YitT family protein [Clostridia bacterium]
MKRRIRDLIPQIRLKNCIFLVLGSAILAFGLFNVHSFSGVTEGGTLGLVLLLDHWLHISPAVTSLVLNGICYFIGWRALGKDFIAYSAVCCLSFSLLYWIFELIGPIYPEIANHRLVAAVAGAVFVGIGVGLCVRFGGAPCGDDALAMSIASKTRIGIKWVYLISDLVVLSLSLTYIPLKDILYSLLTVVLSGQIIGFVEGAGKHRKDERHPSD